MEVRSINNVSSKNNFKALKYDKKNLELISQFIEEHARQVKELKSMHNQPWYEDTFHLISDLRHRERQNPIDVVLGAIKEGSKNLIAQVIDSKSGKILLSEDLNSSIVLKKVESETGTKKFMQSQFHNQLRRLCDFAKNFNIAK